MLLLARGLRDLPGLWTNREITRMTEVPRRLLVLGGGAVGVEMAQATARLGAEAAQGEGAPHVICGPIGDCPTSAALAAATP